MVLRLFVGVLCLLVELGVAIHDGNCRSNFAKRSECTTGSNCSFAPLTHWNKLEVASYLETHPYRAAFTRIFRYPGYRVGLEVGVADGRFSELFLKENSGIGSWTWYMVEPFPTRALQDRAGLNSRGVLDRSKGKWAQHCIGSNAHIVFLRYKSNDPRLMKDLPDNGFDFIYLDGMHTYKYVRRELEHYWRKVRPGGILAGHDYCDFAEKPHTPCSGCGEVPRCGVYTEFNDQLKGKTVASQWGVVEAVHHWLNMSNAGLKLHNTVEEFSRLELQKESFDYDLVLTKTRNPSWFLFKPETL
mmetsp:Transcript_9089/g.21889  ORF Transcript_9089/g.21889 Transcript_9089/m.21889 type:complete len:301 (+) Transcript_9089:199-1101(+)